MPHPGTPLPVTVVVTVLSRRIPDMSGPSREGRGWVGGTPPSLVPPAYAVLNLVMH